MVKPAHVADGIASFAEAEILPALDGWQLWTAGAALILLRQRADDLITGLSGNKAISALGLVDENGMIDADAAINAAKEAARKHGKLTVDIPMLGKFKFGEEDFDALREHILRAGA